MAEVGCEKRQRVAIDYTICQISWSRLRFCTQLDTWSGPHRAELVARLGAPVAFLHVLCAVATDLRRAPFLCNVHNYALYVCEINVCTMCMRKMYAQKSMHKIHICARNVALCMYAEFFACIHITLCGVGTSPALYHALKAACGVKPSIPANQSLYEKMTVGRVAG